MQRPGVNLPSDNSSGESVGSPAPEYGTKNYLDSSVCEKDQLPKSRSGSTKAQNIFCGGDARFITQQGGSRRIFGYPIHLFLMLMIEFCERFCYYGVRSVLLRRFSKRMQIKIVQFFLKIRKTC